MTGDLRQLGVGASARLKWLPLAVACGSEEAEQKRLGRIGRQYSGKTDAAECQQQMQTVTSATRVTVMESCAHPAPYKATLCGGGKITEQSDKPRADEEEKWRR